ncbi:MAG: hypothetical protein JWM85_2432, partial [Acidimicrobiaceae bacterium]|nr:hypothetical protein [Acidimicrobiaceae bacterium]
DHLPYAGGDAHHGDHDHHDTNGTDRCRHGAEGSFEEAADTSDRQDIHHDHQHQLELARYLEFAGYLELADGSFGGHLVVEYLLVVDFLLPADHLDDTSADDDHPADNDPTAAHDNDDQPATNDDHPTTHDDHNQAASSDHDDDDHPADDDDLAPHDDHHHTGNDDDDLAVAKRGQAPWRTKSVTTWADIFHADGALCANVLAGRLRTAGDLPRTAAMNGRFVGKVFAVAALSSLSAGASASAGSTSVVARVAPFATTVAPPELYDVSPIPGTSLPGPTPSGTRRAQTPDYSPEVIAACSPGTTVFAYRSGTQNLLGAAPCGTFPPGSPPDQHSNSLAYISTPTLTSGVGVLVAAGTGAGPAPGATQAPPQIVAARVDSGRDVVTLSYDAAVSCPKGAAHVAQQFEFAPSNSLAISQLRFARSVSCTPGAAGSRSVTVHFGSKVLDLVRAGSVIRFQYVSYGCYTGSGGAQVSPLITAAGDTQPCANPDYLHVPSQSLLIQIPGATVRQPRVTSLSRPAPRTAQGGSTQLRWRSDDGSVECVITVYSSTGSPAVATSGLLATLPCSRGHFAVPLPPNTGQLPVFYQFAVTAVGASKHFGRLSTMGFVDAPRSTAGNLRLTTPRSGASQGAVRLRLTAVGASIGQSSAIQIFDGSHQLAACPQVSLTSSHGSLGATCLAHLAAGTHYLWALSPGGGPSPTLSSSVLVVHAKAGGK